MVDEPAHGQLLRIGLGEGVCGSMVGKYMT
jgi:hypothetical protein